MESFASYDQTAQRIPFRLNGFNGIVSVYYGANDDPHRVGFDSLPGIGFDIQLSRGYPVILAQIEDCEGSGYSMFCGWIQIVTSLYRDSHDPETAQSETILSVDVAPAFQDRDIPFAVYGYQPQLFDAPCLNLGHAAELTWTADTFLTTIPLRSRDEEISWLSGFRWGYVETDIPGKKPVLLPLTVTDKVTWNQHLPYLQAQFSQWKFKAA